ncbi:MAG: hypothetical protein ACKN9K_14435, partial [Dolichospermum sp.]
MIELQQLQEQVLKLPIRERWHLVQTVLASIQQETLSSTTQPTIENLSELRQDEALAAACAVIDELELGWES